MKEFFKGLLERWKVIATKIAVVQTTIILFILYFGIFSIMFLLSFIARQDLLDKRLIPVQSFWKKRDPSDPRINLYKHQF